MLKTTPQNSSLARFVELKAHSPIEGLLTQHVPWLGPAAAEGASGDVRPHLCIRRTHLIPRGTGLPPSLDSYSPGRRRVLWDTIFNASHPQWKMGKKRRCSILSNGFYLVSEIRTGRGDCGRREGHLCGSWERRCLASVRAGYSTSTLLAKPDGTGRGRRERCPFTCCCGWNPLVVTQEGASCSTLGLVR